MLLVESECFLPLRYVKIDSYQGININISNKNFESEISTFFPQLHVIIGCDTTPYKSNV